MSLIRLGFLIWSCVGTAVGITPQRKAAALLQREPPRASVENQTQRISFVESESVSRVVDQTSTQGRTQEEEQKHQQSAECKDSSACGGKVGSDSLNVDPADTPTEKEEDDTSIATIVPDPAINEGTKVRNWVALQAQENLRKAGAFGDDDARIAEDIAEAINSALSYQNFKRGEIRVVGLDSEGDVMLSLKGQLDVYHREAPLDLMTQEARAIEILRKLKWGITQGGAIMLSILLVVVVWIYSRTDDDELEPWTNQLEEKCEKIRDGHGVRSFFNDGLRPDKNPLIFTYHQLVLEDKGFDSSRFFFHSASAFSALVTKYNSSFGQDVNKYSAIDDYLDSGDGDAYVPLREVSFNMNQSLMEQAGKHLSPDRIQKAVARSAAKLQNVIRKQKTEIVKDLKVLRKEVL